MKAQAVVQIHGIALPHVEHVGARRLFFSFGNFASKDAGTAAAHLQRSRKKKKKGWIRRNKLPVDVVEASVNHSQLN